MQDTDGKKGTRKIENEERKTDRMKENKKGRTHEENE